MSERAKIWGDARRFLCVRLDALGDVIMTGPALRAIKQSNANPYVTLLTSPAAASIARYLPDVDETWIYQAPWMKATEKRADACLDRAFIDRLREGRFDAAIIFTVYSQNPLPAAMTCYLADIPLRLAHCRENPYQLLTDWIPEPEPEERLRHEVRRQLDLVRHIGARPDHERLKLELPESCFARARRHLAALRMDRGAPWLIVHPGATADSRRYAPGGFAVAARKLVEQHGCTVIYTGSSEERGLIEEIRGRMQAPSFSLAGQLDVGTLSALIALAPVLVANNTGPVHIAAAMGTPVVDLYALTNPQHMPWEVESRVLYRDVPCKYCYKSQCPLGHNDCLQRVPPDAIVEAVLDLMAYRMSALPIAEAGN